MTMSAGQTSLKRLLALDKTYDNLDDRIDAASGILGLGSSEKTVPRSDTGNHGRHDFIVRWILDKLKKDAAARANAKSWSLLRKTLVALPAPLVSKLLAKAGVFDLVTAALSDHQEAGSSVPSEDGTKLTGKKSKKRSRSGDILPVAATEFSSPFNELSKLLRAFQLPATTQQVAKLAKFWFTELSLGTTNDLDDETKFIAQMWTTSTGRSAKSDSRAAFAQEVAWPALLLASQAQTTLRPNIEQTLRNTLKTELLEPAHDSFLRSTLAAPRTADVGDVKESFGPLAEQICSYLTTSPSGQLETRAANVCKSLSLLFEDCDSLKEHHSPRERRIHSKWIEALFLHIESAVKAPVSGSIDDAVKRQIAVSMLSQVGKDMLTGPVLEKVLLEYGGLGDSAEPDFSIVARALVIDPTVFNAGQTHAELRLDNILTTINKHSNRISDPSEDDVALWVHSLATPLVASQTQPQRAEKFFEQWAKPMTAVSVDGWCVWQHPSTRDAIARLTETSLGVSSLRVILQKAVAQLVSDLDGKTEPSTVVSAILAVAILVDCIRADESVDEMQADFQTVLQSIQGLLPKIKAKKISQAAFWELLVALQDRLVQDFEESADPSDAGASESHSASVADAVEYLRKQAKSKSPSQKGMTAALAYVLQCMQISQTGGIEGAVLTGVLETLVKKHTNLVAAVLLRYPNALSTSSSETASAIHTHVLQQLLEEPSKATEYLDKVINGSQGLAAEARATLSGLIPSAAETDAVMEEADLDPKLSKALKSLEASKITSAMSKDLEPKAHHKLRKDLVERLSSKATTSEAIDLACTLLGSDASGPGVPALAVVSAAVHALPATAPSEPSEVTSGRSIVVSLLSLMTKCESKKIFNAAAQSLGVIVQHKRWLINQDLVESTLSTLHRLCSASASIQATSKGRFIYNDICSLLQSILRFHRPSLGRRLHIVSAVLKQLLACLFVQSKNMATTSTFQRTFQQPRWLTQSDKKLAPDNARSFARIITLLCNPPQSTIPGYRAGDQVRLTDVVREARVHVSEFAPLLLHAHCHFQLHGVMIEGVREALTPAIYALFDVMDMAEPEDKRVIALGASMGKPELALLRKEHGEWKRFGRWRGA